MSERAADVVVSAPSERAAARQESALGVFPPARDRVEERAASSDGSVFGAVLMTPGGRGRSGEAVSPTGPLRRRRQRASVGKISAKCCSFSAISAPIFASKYAFDSIFQALQDLHTFAPLQSQNFSKKSV